MDFFDALLSRQLNGGGGGGGDTNLADLDIFVADFLQEPPTITDGALDGYNRKVVS